MGQGVTQPSTEQRVCITHPVGPHSRVTAHQGPGGPGAMGGRWTKLVEQDCWHRGSQQLVLDGAGVGLHVSRRRVVLHHQRTIINKPQRALPTHTHSTSHPQGCACTPSPSLSPCPNPQLEPPTIPVPCAGSTSGPLGQVSQPLPLPLPLPFPSPLPLPIPLPFPSPLPFPLPFPLPPPPTRGSLVKSDNRRGGLGGGG